MGNQFSIGDTVQRISHPFDGVKVGFNYIVDGFGASKDRLKLRGRRYIYDSENFKLIKSAGEKQSDTESQTNIIQSVAAKEETDMEETHMAHNFEVGNWVRRVDRNVPNVFIGQTYLVKRVDPDNPQKLELDGVPGVYSARYFEIAPCPNPVHTKITPDPTPDNGVKYDSDKPRMDLVLSQLPAALLSLGSCLGYGAAKYSEDNWTRVPDASKRYMAAVMRHILAFQQGEELDPESGKPHLAHAATNLMFVLELNLRDKK